jgi:(S)-2-hydroxy-acid oxidase
MKCLALGADAVFVNRPVGWGLCYKGENGLKELLCMLNEEVRLAMALTHCFKIKDITQD